MSTIEYRLFRRQFFLGSYKIKFDSNWVSLQTKSSQWLSHCNSLPVEVVQDRNGNEWILLGDAVDCRVDALSPSDAIKSYAGINPIENIYSFWSGRWLLIGLNEVHPDASSLLSCYYHRSGIGIEISSVPYFLTGTEIPQTYLLRKGVGFESYPPPDTGFKSVDKLLATQILNLNTGHVRFRNIIQPNTETSEERIIHELVSCQQTILKNIIAKQNKKPVVALTAGYDSRVLLATLQHAGVRCDTFTFGGPMMPTYDRKIPAQLAKIAGLKYRFIGRGKINTEKDKLYSLHSCYHAVERDRDLMKYQQFDELDPDTLLLRGGAFEVGSCAYYKYMPAQKLTPEQIGGYMQANPFQVESIRRYMNWVDKNPIEEMDWRDRYYLEQRVGGWLSCTELALDLVNIDRFVPANCNYFFNLMLNIPEAKRRKKLHQVEMIRLLSPELLALPINPPTPRYIKKLRKFIFLYERWTQKKELPPVSILESRFRSVKYLDEAPLLSQ